ncbi:MAG: glycosyltransferase [Candidatus Binataceae bacterium]
MPEYIAITPARDEEALLPGLISSMTAQTCKPRRWIIIDDGSSDSTGAIIDRAASQHRWIEPRHLPANRPRAAGGESVIMRFLPPEIWRDYDFILRLDADLTFAPDTIELVMTEFAKDPKLGLAGTVLHERRDSGWREVRHPSFHTRGAFKMYSSECFAKIGGLTAGIGWDTIDEAHAMMLGFTTRSFRHIIAYHHRPQGAAGGILHGRFGTGRTAYVLGYSPLFMIVRSLSRIASSPPMVGSLMLLAGYFDGYLRRLPRSASPELIKFIRRQQHRRLLMLPSAWR